MENVRTEVTKLTYKVVEFGKKMEKEEFLSKDTGILEGIYNATDKYNKKELYVLVSGEVKTGKSSLINSILGEEICTVDSSVCTNTNTMIRYGETEKITVYFAQDEEGNTPEPIIITREEIKTYVSERKNKNNKKNVRFISVEIPNEHLKSGLVLIDSPGLGSLNPLHAATTFSIAPVADVIILVATADSELKESEISYIKQLLECSKSKMVIHALTHCDSGDPETVLSKNIKHLQQAKEWKDGELQYCMLSNTNYQEFLNKEIEDIAVTGFDKFFALLKQVEDNVEYIMAENQLAYLFNALQQYGSTLNVLLQSFSSPEKLAEKKRQVETAKTRLQEILQESSSWQIELNGMIEELSILVNDRITANYSEIKQYIETKLEVDEYIENPEQLGGIVSAEISAKSYVLQEYLNKLFAKTYISLKEKSQLQLVQQELNPINNEDIKCSIDGINVDILRTYYGEYISNVMAGSLIGGIIGGVIGGVIGTFFAPGIGTLGGIEAGAAIAGTIGNVIGHVATFIKGKAKVKQQKRQQILKKVTDILRDSQNDLNTKIKLVITKGKTELFKLFKNEVEAEKTKCNNILKGLDADSKQRELISSLKRECSLYDAQTAKLYNTITKV